MEEFVKMAAEMRLGKAKESVANDLALTQRQDRLLAMAEKLVPAGAKIDAKILRDAKALLVELGLWEL